MATKNGMNITYVNNIIIKDFGMFVLAQLRQISARTMNLTDRKGAIKVPIAFYI